MTRGYCRSESIKLPNKQTVVLRLTHQPVRRILQNKLPKNPRKQVSQKKMEEAKEGRGSMVDLPHEMLLTIFFKLPLTDVVSCLFVCYKWSVLATDDTLWKPFFVEKWPEERLTEGLVSHPFQSNFSQN